MGCALCSISIALLLASVGTVSGIGIAFAQTAGDWYTKPDWWVALFTGLLFLATLLLWVFTALLWWTTKKAVADGEKAVETANAAVVAANRHADESANLVAVTRDTAERQLRAYVMVESAVVKNIQEMGEPSILVTIRNFGQTPAYDATFWFGPGWDRYPPSVEPPPFPSEAHLVRHPIGPGGRTEMNMILPMRLTARHITGLNDREVAIYATGQVRYQDVFDKSRMTEFRLCANGPTIFSDGIMSATEKGNFST
jgi:hypothetical protein